MNQETRNGRRGNDSKNASQQRQSAGSRDGTPHANPSQQSRKGAGAKSGSNASLSRSTDNNGQNGSAAAGQTTGNTLPSSEEQYTPTAGFNYDAVDAALKQGYDLRAPLYKPEPNVAQTTKPETPWGLKPGSMANGRDFWLDLRKQVAALQQSGGTSQGG